MRPVGIPFFETTSVRPTASEGRYEGTIDESWNLRPLPQGGIVSALGLRAMSQTLDDPTQRLRTLHTTFIAQVAAGEVTVEVELLRRGRTMSHLRAEVANVEAQRGHLTTGVFGSTRTGFDFTELPPPVGIPLPDDCPSFRDPIPGEVAFEPMPFWERRVEGRRAMGHRWDEEWVPDKAETATWYRFDDPPFLPDETIDPLALVVLIDTMPGAVGEKVGRQDRPWFSPSVDLSVHVLDDCRSPWVLAHNRSRYAGDGYASVDMALWDYGASCTDEPRLVAYATQLCLFTFLD
jgi:acyl-CoA thioesterase